MPAFAPPDLGTTVSTWANIMLAALVLFVIALFWYLPFLAWVGLLGTIFKRWAIPLAFLIPAIIGVFERVIAENLLVAGQFWTFITERFELHFEGLVLEGYWLTGEPWNGLELVTLMLTGTDWISLIGGVAIAAVLIYAASEYRRRYVLT
jgi:ABC-2 type transport system permease protein